MPSLNPALSPELYFPAPAAIVLPMKITLIRHGESESNVRGYINDDPARPVPLTERGKVQAESAAISLRSVPYTLAFVSEFQRAGETAAILLRYHNCPLQIDSRLNERRSGMDGRPSDIFNDMVSPDPAHIKPEQGESFLELMDRMRRFLDDVAEQHPQAVILAVSHQHPMLAALALSGTDPEEAARSSLANCSWIDLVWPDSRESDLRAPLKITFSGRHGKCFHKKLNRT